MGLYVALLRGINVGGNNLIKMADLKDCFEQNGYVGASTYIASGNVLFEAKGGSAAELTRKLETMLAKRFSSYKASVVLRSHAQMRKVVENAPKGYGQKPKEYRYDVLFLKAPLTAKKAIRDIPTKEGVDAVSAATGVLYFSRLDSKASSSRLNRVASMPIYQSMTIRTWNTTVKLLELMDSASDLHGYSTRFPRSSGIPPLLSSP